MGIADEIEDRVDFERDLLEFLKPYHERYSLGVIGPVLSCVGLAALRMDPEDVLEYYRSIRACTRVVERIVEEKDAPNENG
jgi:hypothetical protein